MIKNWKQFREANGIEWVGAVGPGWPDIEHKPTVGQEETDIKMCDIDRQLYTYDDYTTMYQDYLKLGEKPLHGFTTDNLNVVVLKLSEAS
jgi:hypothetical protein